MGVAFVAVSPSSGTFSNTPVVTSPSANTAPMITSSAGIVKVYWLLAVAEAVSVTAPRFA